MKKQKGFSNMIGILLILIVLAGGVYIYTQKTTNNNQDSVSRTETTRDDWKTYEDIGYSIQYPSNWSGGMNMKHDFTPVVFCPPELASNDESVCQLSDKFDGIYMKAGGYATKAPISIQRYAKSLPENPSPTTHYWEVNDKSAYEGKARYVITLADEKYEDIYRQMVGSIKIK